MVGRAAGFVIAALVLGACGGSDQPAPGLSPLGGTWFAIRIDGEDVSGRADIPALQFTVGRRLVGESVCRDLDAAMDLDGVRLSFGEIAQGPADPSCTPDDLRLESTFLQLLSEVEAYSGGRPGDRLTLSGPAGDIILASRRPASATPA